MRIPKSQATFIILFFGVAGSLLFALALHAAQLQPQPAELQLRAQLSRSDSEPARLGGGVIDVSETIIIRQSEGGGIIGLPGQTSTVRGGYRGDATELRWVGKQGGTLIRIEDSINVKLSGLILNGNGTTENLIHVAKGERWGSAHITLQNTTLKRTKVGVRFGTSRDDPTCSDSVMSNVVWNDCRIGVWTTNDQSVNHLVISGGWVNCGVGWLAERGGNVTFIGASAGATDVLLRILGGGMNASKFALISPRLEATGDTNRHMTIVDARPSGECHVLIQQGQEGGANRAGTRDNSSEPRFVVGPRAIVDVRGHRHLAATPIASVERGGLYRDRDSIFAVPPSGMFHFGGGGSVEVTGATSPAAEPYKPIHQ